MASLYAVYFDESGTHVGSDVVTVAGFVSNIPQWKEFSKKWQQVLTDSGLACFHMSDFESARGEFDGWLRDKRQNLLNKLLSIIQEHTFWSVGCSVTRHSFESILSDAAKKICGDAYGLAALSCWRHLGLFLRQHDAWMECTMEAGAKGAGALQLIFEEDVKFQEWSDEHRILRLSFAHKRNFPPLQAADIIAYELCKQRIREVGKETRKPRYPLTVLAKKKYKWVYMQEQHLREFNDDVNRQLADTKKLKSAA